MKNIYLLTFLIAVVTFVSPVHGQAPKYSNEFLSIGVGARALGMGNSHVACVDDATASYWNPAGLTLIKGNVEVAAMHNEYFAGIAKYDYGSIIARIDETRAVGFSLIRLGVDNIPETTDLIDASGYFDYNRLKSFSAADYAFLFSYAMQSKTPGLRFGGNAKIVHRKVGSFAKAWGFGLDVGAQYERGKWIFGLAGKDITTTFNGWSFNLSDELKDVWRETNNEIPENSVEITLPKAIFGTGYKTELFKKFTALTEFDFDVTFDGQRNVAISNKPFSIDPHIGWEFGYDGFVFLRFGLNNIQKVKDMEGTRSTIFQPNLGLGIKLKNLSVDYALTNIGGGETLYSNVFSLKFDIYKHTK